MERLERSIQEVIARRWDLYEHALHQVAVASSSGAATPFHEQADAALHDINRMLLHHRRLTQHVRLQARHERSGAALATLSLGDPA